MPCVLIAHVALFLFAQISPSIRCSLGNRLITNIAEATSVLVSAQANAGKDRVCELVHVAVDGDAEGFTVAGVSFPQVTTYFEFQNVKYEFDEEKHTFVRVVYPTASTLGSFCSHAGHKTSGAVEAALEKWGRNEFEIPMPEFVDLYLVCVL
jgi:manganese-transporting P-type ATPase